MGISRSATVVCAFRKSRASLPLVNQSLILEVMQRWGLSRSDAKLMVRNIRNVANPNHSFYTQLKVWEKCKYNIQASISIDGVKPFKLEYQVRPLREPSLCGQAGTVDAHKDRNGWRISKRQTEKRR